MKKILRLLYSYAAVPVLFTLTLIAALINRKIRNAVKERFLIGEKTEKYLSDQNSEKSRIIIHCASMGEFEHIKPLIKRLSEYRNISIIITFFSPSGYDHVKKFEGVDLIIYAPFDFEKSWRRLLDKIKPKLLIISKHDAWPNQVWVSKDKKIPLFLVNASLNENSSRINGIAGLINRFIFPEFDAVYCVSNGDKNRFEQFFPGTHAIRAGDTKFDQVRIRKEISKGKNLISQKWIKDFKILLLGSIWPEDYAIFKKSLTDLLNEFDNLKIIIVPHQPSREFIDEIRNNLKKFELQIFSKPSKSIMSRILLVDRIGILADLYKYADIAYVGGSFKQGIHNVMEPAIYGLPVLYGPYHKNSYDAVKLLENEGSKVVLNENDLLIVLQNLIKNTEYRKKLGQNALNFADSHTGTTDRLIKLWELYL